MNVSWRCQSPFHANVCVFSLNEQQEVYKNNDDEEDDIITK